MIESGRDYPFLQDSDTLTQWLVGSWNRWSSYVGGSPFNALFLRAYRAYYSQMVTRNHQVVQIGQQEELTAIQINHLRNLIKNILASTTQNRIGFDCVVNSTDPQARNESIIGQNYLDYLVYDKGFEQYFKESLEMSLVFGTAFAFINWDLSKKLIGNDAEGNPVYAGEPSIKVMGPFDVLAEPFKDDWEQQNWCVVREQANKHDLAALYPEHEEDILNLPRIKDIQRFVPFYEYDNHTVWTYKAFHKPTPALPNGRYTVFCENGVVLLDQMENPYEGLPVEIIRPDKRFGGIYGHTPLFDALPIQETLNMLDSSMLTIANNFSLPNFVASKRSNIDASNLAGNMRLLEIDPDPNFPNNGIPQVLDTPGIPAPLVNYRESLVNDMEKVMGVSPIARGNFGQLTSGTALAVAASAAQVYNSGIENSYQAFVAKCATKLIKMAQRFMQVDELIAISGNSRKFMIEEFKGDKIKSIQRVRVQVGNNKSFAVRMELANQLLNMQQLTPEEYLEVMQSGNLPATLDKKTQQLALINLENELLMRGQKPTMSVLDNHQLHIQDHADVLNNPAMRNDPALVSATMNHIQEHLDAMVKLANENPMLLSIALGQPIQMPAPGQQGYGAAPTPANPEAAAKMSPQPPQEASQNAEIAASPGGVEAVAESAVNRAAKLQEDADQAAGLMG